MFSSDTGRNTGYAGVAVQLRVSELRPAGDRYGHCPRELAPHRPADTRCGQANRDRTQLQQVVPTLKAHVSGM